MTEHLQECWAKFPSDPPAWCICDELRACEARVQKIAYQEGLGAGSDEHRQHEIGWIKGYAAALDAARKAVAALRGYFGTDGSGDGTVWVEKIEALSAIDALREGDQP